jgi:hypothetical protein
MCVAPFAWSGAGDYPSRPRGGAARGLTGGEDDAEVLRVQRPGLALGERRGRMRTDPDAGVAKARVEDVGAVVGRGHPGADDRLGGGQPECAPGDVLADDVADLRAVDVAAGAHPVERGVPAGRDVREVVLAGHVFAVALRGAGELGVGRQGALAVARAFAVDQAEDRGADLFEVARLRREVGVRARARRGGFRGGGFCGVGFGRKGEGRRSRPGREGRAGGEGRPCEAGRPACRGRRGAQAGAVRRGPQAGAVRRGQSCATSACHARRIDRSVSEPERARRFLQLCALLTRAAAGATGGGLSGRAAGGLPTGRAGPGRAGLPICARGSRA